MNRRTFLKGLLAISTATVVGKVAASAPKPEYTGTLTLGNMESGVDRYWNHSDHRLDATRYMGNYKLATISGNRNSKGIPTIDMANTGKLTIRRFRGELKVVNEASLS